MLKEDLYGFKRIIKRSRKVWRKRSKGNAITVTGIIVKSEGSGQNYELKVKEITLEGDCPEDYPMQPKKHSREFLREQAYLRPRTNLFQAVFRIRSVTAMAIHTYFQERGYIYLHAPILTASDCEGAGKCLKLLIKI